MDTLNVIYRSFISLLTLFIITKIIGKKQVSELSLFDYVIGLSIGNFAAEITVDNSLPFSNGLVAMTVFGIVAYTVSLVTMKSIILRRLIIGVPTIIIEKGSLLYRNLKKTKYDVNDLLEECRNNGYFDLCEIEYAIVEANGKISFLPKDENKPVTKKDMNFKKAKSCLNANIIVDGKLIKNNLKSMHKTMEWFNQQLSVRGYLEYKNILLATLDEEDKIMIYKKNNKESIKILE